MNRMETSDCFCQVFTTGSSLRPGDDLPEEGQRRA